MDEISFIRLSQHELSSIESAVERAIAGADLDCDVQLREGGIVEIVFEDGAKAVINQHLAMQEIWLAARTGAHHFRIGEEGWRDTRNGASLRQTLADVLSDLSRGALVLAPEWIVEA